MLDKRHELFKYYPELLSRDVESDAQHSFIDFYFKMNKSEDINKINDQIRLCKFIHIIDSICI